MAGDIVNLLMATYAGAPVADIDHGGVFAQIVGTLAGLPSEQQAQIRGFIINRFRGDLEWLHRDGWTDPLQREAAAGGHLLGRAVHDPQGVEAAAGTTPGLALLATAPELKAPKTITLTDFTWKAILSLIGVATNEGPQESNF